MSISNNLNIQCCALHPKDEEINSIPSYGLTVSPFLARISDMSTQ
jgi:hypothetical protein